MSERASQRRNLSQSVKAQDAKGQSSSEASGDQKRPRLVRWWLIFGAGLLIGWLVIGWGIWPVRWSNTSPASLRPQYQRLYVQLLADSYGRTNDVALVQQALADWDREELNTLLFRMESEAATAERRDRLADLRAALDLSTPEPTFLNMLMEQKLILLTSLIPLVMLVGAGGIALVPALQASGQSSENEDETTTDTLERPARSARKRAETEERRPTSELSSTKEHATGGTEPEAVEEKPADQEAVQQQAQTKVEQETASTNAAESENDKLEGRSPLRTSNDRRSQSESEDGGDAEDAGGTRNRKSTENKKNDGEPGSPFGVDPSPSQDFDIDEALGEEEQSTSQLDGFFDSDSLDTLFDVEDELDPLLEALSDSLPDMSIENLRQKCHTVNMYLQARYHLDEPISSESTSAVGND